MEEKKVKKQKTEESKASNIFVSVLFSVLAVVIAATVVIILNH